MSSVKSVSFTCPNCSKVLRASARPPAGKKVKCPACSEPFVPELDDEEAATKIQDKPRVKAKPAPSRLDDDEDDEKPRNKKSRADEDDDDRPRKKRSRDDDEEDEDDRSSKKKKSKKKSGGSMLMILLGVVFLGGGGLLGCIGCGVGAWFFWPSGNNELAAYISPDANLLVGGRPKELKTKFSGFKNMFQQAAGPGPNDQFPEMEDLVLNSEQFLLFTNTNNLNLMGPGPGGGGAKGMVLIFKAQPADIERVKKSNRLEPAKVVGGHTIHKMKGQGNDLLAISGQHVIFSDLEEGKLQTVLDRGKKSPAKSAAIDLSRSVDRSPMWVAFTFDGETRKGMRDMIEMAGDKVPSMKAAGPALDGAKGLTFTMDVVGANDLKVTASVMCKNSSDAGKVKTGLEDGWKLAKGAIDAFMAFGPGPQGPDARAMQLMMQDLGKMSFSTSGDSATATLTFSNATVEELAKAGKNKPFPIGGFNPPPPPKFDGPKKDGFKDFPKKVDGVPKAKGRLIQSFTHMNINAGDKRESIIQLQQGKRITVTMVSTTKGFADVDLFVYSGAPGGNIIDSDSTIGPNGNVAFVVPQTGPYRIEVRNLGQGRATTSVVNVYEE